MSPSSSDGSESLQPGIRRQYALTSRAWTTRRPGSADPRALAGLHNEGFPDREPGGTLEWNALARARHEDVWPCGAT